MYVQYNPDEFSYNALKLFIEYNFIAYLATARRFLKLNSSGLVTTPNVAEKYSNVQQGQKVPPTPFETQSRVTDRCASFETESSLTEHKQNILQRIQGRIVSVTDTGNIDLFRIH